jgi:hypothetical protein
VAIASVIAKKLKPARKPVNDLANPAAAGLPII